MCMYKSSAIMRKFSSGFVELAQVCDAATLDLKI